MNNQTQLQPPPDTFIKPMLEVREHYTREVEKFELLHRQALENLNHVEALLSIWSSTNTTTPSTSASNQQDSPLPQTENISEQLNTTKSNSEVNQYEATGFVAENLATTNDDDNHHQLSLNLAADSSQSAPQTQTQSITDTDTQQHTPIETDETEGNSLSYTEIPMLPEYDDMTRTEAILKLLKQHVGTVCHIDFIVRSLYGNLKGNPLKLVKDRVYSTLSHGIETKKWFKVPGQPACYTLILSLIPSTSDSSVKKANKKNFKPAPQPSSYVVPMLEPYQGQFLIDALTFLFKQNPGKVFNVAEVVRAIYGELNNEDFREVKTKVLNELSRGYRTGRFSKVPEKIGLYTWDANLL